MGDEMENDLWKVLIVDDDPNNLELLGNILKSHYQLSFATDGHNALVVANKVKPDIILLDIMMPGIDGYETCRRLKGNTKTSKIPVIFITAKKEIKDEEYGFEVGGVDFLTKPVSESIVIARVRTHIEIHNQKKVLEKMVQKRTRQLSQTFEKLENYSLDTIHRLTRASEYKDEDTGAHIKRMSQYAATIARHIGFNDYEIKAILHAAPMHDIGKIGIPDRILLKPGKLDADEWEIMKQHTTFGKKILEGSDAEYLKLGEIITQTHHEKWDGSGYPKGMKNKEIPIEGRIIAIADVFDALTSKRPYKGPFSVEKSFTIIEEGRNKHFDPAVVDAFFAVQEELLIIKEKYKDNDMSLFLKLCHT